MMHAPGRQLGSIRSTVALCGVFIVLVLIMFVISVVRTPTLSDAEMASKGVFLLPTPRDIAPFALNGADGSTVTNATFLDRWTFVFFGFTNCPDICPTSMSVLAQAYQRVQAETPEIARRMQVMLISVDPERDTPEKLATYVHAFNPAFRGATGDRDALATLATQVNVAFAAVPLEDGGYTVDHTGNIVIINPKGHYHGFMKMPHDAETIALTAQTLSTRL